MKTQQEIRESFLTFFKNNGHTIVPSAPVIPQNDNTLLFTNAGMNQFKNIFLGTGKITAERIADTQKCLRVSGKHNDLDEVGRDTYHHTFFEMLGNWSFGEYFKKEAIRYAWLFLTDVCKLPAANLYATYFGGDKDDNMPADDEAKELWGQVTSIPQPHIMPFGKKDNFWEMGDTGPCGPCSEIHIDMGADSCDKKDVSGHKCGVNGDCRRFMEIWNLVFIQYNRKKDKSLDKLEKNHVDTGMGFERLVSILQGKQSNYDTDLFTPLLKKITEVTGITYGAADDTDVAMRVAADHIKALSFAIADGALPDKKGRGSVLRSLLRRASRFGRQVLKQEKPFVYMMVDTVAEIYKGIFPEVYERREYIAKVVKDEEELFAQTLESGLERFMEMIRNIGGKKEIDGFEAYRLYHQEGFPKDLIAQMAAEHNLTIDEGGWNKAEEEHKKRSKGEIKEALFESTLLENLPSSEFTGYWEDGKSQLTGTKNTVRPVKMPSPETLILEKTPFYAQSGGQVGDTGCIEAENFLFKVEDTQKMGDFIIHIGKLEKGSAESLPKEATATVDYKRRKAIMAAHTATHILHWTLRKIIGEHVFQKGSEVTADYLRFDFTHPQALTQSELLAIEKAVNEKIMENLDVSMSLKNINDAKQDGVMALFGEKYGDTVRVVNVGGFSKELCGGTHCERTGDIGYFYITSESSSEAGVRRIEAITGHESLMRVQKERMLLKSISTALNTQVSELPSRIEAMSAQIKELKKLKAKEDKKDLGQLRDELLLHPEEFNGIRTIVKSIAGINADNLGELADDLRSASKICGILISADNGNISIVGFASKDIAGKDKINIGAIVKECCSILGGGGGGRFDFAKGGGKDSEKIDEAIKAAKSKLAELAVKI